MPPYTEDDGTPNSKGLMSFWTKLEAAEIGDAYAINRWQFILVLDVTPSHVTVLETNDWGGIRSEVRKWGRENLLHAVPLPELKNVSESLL